MTKITCIIIPTFNNEDYTIRCLNSIKNNTKDYIVIWVDNASDQYSKDEVKKFIIENNIPYKLIENNENLGFVKAVNQGIRKSIELSADYIVLQNNDTEVYEGWLDELIKISNFDPKIGLVGPISSPCDSWQSIKNIKKYIKTLNNIPEYKDNLNEYAREIREKYKDQFEITNRRLAFFSVLIKKELIVDVGYLSEDFGVGFADDDDYSIRAIKKGWKLCIAKGVFVFHNHRTTFKKIYTEEKISEMLKSNKDKLIKKHLNIFNDIEKEKKICFISHSAEMMGSERSLLDLIDGLMSLGFKCSVIIPRRGSFEESLKERLIPYYVVEYRQWVLMHGESPECVNNKINSQLEDFISVLKEINPDIIYTNTSVINIGSLAAKKLLKPHIWHIREFGEIDHDMTFTLPIEQRSEYIFNNSDYVIFNSKAVEKYYLGPRKNSVVIYNNVDINKNFIKNDDDVRYFNNKDYFKIAIVGSIIPSKNQRDVILATKELIKKGIKTELLIVGDGDKKYIKNIKEIVSKNNLNEYIKFLGYVHKPYKVFFEADVIVCCSKNEAFGRVIVEAMLMNKIVVATNSGGVPEIIENGLTGFLYTPEKYIELFEKLKFIFENKEKIREISNNGYNFVKSNFNFSNYSLKIANIVSSVLDSQLNFQKLQKENLAIKEENSRLIRQLKSKNDELFFVYNSISWKLVVFLRKIIDLSLPLKTLRRKIAVKSFKIFEKGIVFFILKLKKIKEKHINLKKEEVKNKIKNIYIISNGVNGGSKKYIDDLINNFAGSQIGFVQIKSKKELFNYKKKIHSDDILIFQYLFNTDLSFNDILKFKKITKIKIVVPIHDFYFLGDNKKDFYKVNSGVYENYTKRNKINKEVFDFLKNADIIIFPSLFVKNIFDSIYKFDNTVFIKHIDYKITDFLNIPNIEDNIINIGIINNITEYKGANYYSRLFSIKKYGGYHIKYHIFGMVEKKSKNVHYHGKYNEQEIFELLEKNNIHGLVFLNKWGETYSYSLTKGIVSGLPISYSNIGSYIERLRGSDKFFPIKNIKKDIRKMFDFIIEKEGVSNTNSLLYEKDIPEFYQKLFFIDYSKKIKEKYIKNKKIYKKIFNFVEPYAIYFPQFHFLEENRESFYDGYHDMVNLRHAKKELKYLETPLTDYLGFYNLKEDKDIINKQINLAQAYGFKGFGVYYYWFSHNTVTQNNMLMKDVMDQFFNQRIDNFDVFFIYANENWTGNPSFNQRKNNCVIKNIYTEEQIIKNFENLLFYFKNENYKKIDNKPVFFIHHPWVMNEDELKLFSDIGNKIMRENGFDGLELFVNGMKGNIDGYKNYSHHSDYKNISLFTDIKNGIKYLDYKKYVKRFVPNMPYRSKNIHGIFFNFNNIVRYFYHRERNKLITITINNEVSLFKDFLLLQLKTYFSSDKVSKIFLVNSWNEWGEQMAVEPSNEEGFKLLDVFSDSLISFYNKNKNKISRFYKKTNNNYSVNKNKICVVLHLYYLDMWEEIKGRLENIPYDFYLIVSLTENRDNEEIIKKIKEYKKDAKIIILENKGMDILPFLKCLKYVPDDTKFLLKIHSKKSILNPDFGGIWFNDIMNHLLLNKELVSDILGTIKYTKVGMVGGSDVDGLKYGGILKDTDYYEEKIELIHDFFEDEKLSFKWFSGSMFWVDYSLIKKLKNEDFINFFENKQPSGYFLHETIAHGLERYFGRLVYENNRIISINPKKISMLDYVKYFLKRIVNL